MVTDIHSTITKCTTCAQNRLALRRHRTPLTLFRATEPLRELSVNICGLIPASKKGNRFILVITRGLRINHGINVATVIASIRTFSDVTGTDLSRISAFCRTERLEAVARCPLPEVGKTYSALNPRINSILSGFRPKKRDPEAPGYHRPLRQAHQVRRLTANYGHVHGVSHHRRVGVL